MGHFELVEKQVSELDYAARSSVRLFNHTRYEAMHNVSAHQLPQNYRAQWVPFPALNYFGHLIYASQTNTY